MGERKLTPEEETGLHWMIQCNNRGIGYLGPTVRKQGALPIYSGLVGERLAKLVMHDYHHRTGKGGYWITAAGRAALEASNVS